MPTEIREKTVVNKDGMVQIRALDLPIGTKVEVVVTVDIEEMDTTEYLLSTEANRKHLERAMQDAKDPEKRIYVDIENL